MKKACCAFLLFLLLPAVASAAEIPSIDIPDYSSDISLETPGLFLLAKGDDPSFSAAGFDDSSWLRVTAPSSWENSLPGWHGISWYRIHLHFPDTLPLQSFGVNLGRIVAADEVYFNGQRIGGSGVIGAKPVFAYDKVRLYEIPSSLILPGRDNVLAVRVQGLNRPTNGLFKGPLLAGSFVALQKQVFHSDLFNLLFIAVYAVFALFFMIFYFNRKNSAYYLYFSLFCISMGLYLFLRTQIKHEAGFDFYYAKKLEYLTLPLHLAFFLEFIRSFYNRRRSAVYYIYYAYVAALEILLLSSSAFEEMITVNHYLNQPGFIFPAGMTFFILGSEVKRRNSHALAMGALLLLCLCFMVNDLLVDWGVYDFIRLDKYGIILVLLGFSIIMGKRVLGIYSRLEDLTQTLEQKVQERTDELHSANERLQAFNRHISELNDSYHQDYLLAAKVQKGLTPQPFGNQHWQIAVCFQPTSAISGDFYDIYRLDRDSLCLVLADASGHGVAAALVTMIAKPVFAYSMKHLASRDIKEAVEKANTELLEEIGEIREFLSAQAVRLDQESLAFVNAGHPPAMFLHGRDTRLLQSSGPFLGVPELVMPYQEESVEVSKGDCLLMFSDALIEARNEKNEEFGLVRIQSVFERGFSSPENLISALTEEVYLFCGSRRLKDDLTIIACRRTDS